LSKNQKKQMIMSIYATFAVLVVICVAIIIIPSYHHEKVMINDLTPLAGVIDDTDLYLISQRSIKLDLPEDKDYGTITILFKNKDTGDKYFVDFSYGDSYLKDTLSTLPVGEYKVKLIEKGSLDFKKLSEKTVTVTEKDPAVSISFK